MQNRPGFHCGNRGGSFCVMGVSFALFQRSRHPLRGFLIAACAGGKIAEFLLSGNIIPFLVDPAAFLQAPPMRGKGWYTQCAKRLPPDHPRACGEKMEPLDAPDKKEGSPPHMRGKADLLNLRTFCKRITPAYAGKRPVRWAKPDLWKDHPRTCGEKVGGKRRLKIRWGITPAHAGKRRASVRWALGAGDHPRACREKSSVF